MAKLLLDENPLVVQPSLAAAIGLNEAIALQQLHYWLNKSDFYIDSRKWVYNTMAEWHKQLFFWSLKTVERTFKNLIKLGIVIVANYNRSKIDKTLWYSIDYDILSKFVEDYLFDSNEQIAAPDSEYTSESIDNEPLSPYCQIDLIENTKMDVPYSQNDRSIQSNCLIHLVNLGGPIPETTTEITTDTISQSIGLSDSQEKTDADGQKDGLSAQNLFSHEKTKRAFTANVSADKDTNDSDITCISKIIKDCNLGIFFDKDMANAITMALQNLYFDKEFAHNNLKLPLEVVRERMQNLCGEMIEFGVKKMQRAAAYGTRISSPTNYLQSCIFNAISEYTTYLLSDEYLSQLSLDKTHKNTFDKAPEELLQGG